MTVIGLSNELQLHIKKLQARATLSVVAILAAVICLVFGVAFLLVLSWVAIPCFIFALIAIAYLVYAKRAARTEEKQGGFAPVVFSAGRRLPFQEVTAFFESITEARDQLSSSEDVRFFKTDHLFKLRAIVCRTDCFDKKAFDAAKERINQRANKALNISPWTNLSEARKMMRFNIVCTDTLNDELLRLLSQNALRNLTRVEGIIHMAVIGSEIMIPPLYGDCDLSDIHRYKSVIRFIQQTFSIEE